MLTEKETRAFIATLSKFQYEMSGLDHVWNIIFPDKNEKWRYMRVIKYRETYYFSLFDLDISALEVTSDGKLQAEGYEGTNAWETHIHAAHRWIKKVEKDWIKTNKQVYTNYPLKARFGIVPNALVRASLPDIYQLDKALGKAKTKQFIQIVESGYLMCDENTMRDTMTAQDYFDYCKIAYIAGQREDDRVDKTLSGRKMYQRYADGRDEGLLEISADSEEEFAQWIDGKHPKKTTGGHPWEIKRGGNTTHIDLYVSRPAYYKKEGFRVVLNGPSIGRLKETICMFLALHDANLPVSIENPEGIRKRLLAQDNIGIVPCFDTLHRANQHFPDHQNVYDVIYFDDFGRYKRRIQPFIIWEPLPILKPQ